MRTTVFATGLAVALFCGFAWVYSILDAQDRIAHMTGSGGAYYGMDLIVADAAVVYGVLGVIIALVGLFLRPREDTGRAALVRRRWALRTILVGSVLLALAGVLLLPITIPFVWSVQSTLFFTLLGSGIPVLVIGVILMFTAGTDASAATAPRGADMYTRTGLGVLAVGLVIVMVGYAAWAYSVCSLGVAFTCHDVYPYREPATLVMGLGGGIAILGTLILAWAWRLPRA